MKHAKKYIPILSIKGGFRRRSIRFKVKSICLLFIAVSTMLTGCLTNNDESESQNQIASIHISPDSASIAVGSSREFTAYALNAAGDTVHNAEIQFNWWSSDTEVFTVEDNGTATGKAEGSAFCIIEIATRNRAAFTGRDSAFVSVF